MNSSNLLGKRAMVTGGGSGICLALAKSLRAHQVPLLILDISLHQEAQAWLQAIQRESGTKIVFHKTDVTVRAQLEGAFDVFAQLFGGAPEIVVAGAGIYEASSAGFWDDKDAYL